MDVIHEALAGWSPQLRFGITFCELPGPVSFAARATKNISPIWARSTIDESSSPLHPPTIGSSLPARGSPSAAPGRSRAPQVSAIYAFGNG